jgi:hypothetical protein
MIVATSKVSSMSKEKVLVRDEQMSLGSSSLSARRLSTWHITMRCEAVRRTVTSSAARVYRAAMSASEL